MFYGSCFWQTSPYLILLVQDRQWSWWLQVSGLVQERRNSSALAMELRLSCTNPSMYNVGCVLCSKRLKFPYNTLDSLYPGDAYICHWNKSSSVHVLAWFMLGAKPLPEPKLNCKNESFSSKKIYLKILYAKYETFCSIVTMSIFFPSYLSMATAPSLAIWCLYSMSLTRPLGEDSGKSHTGTTVNLIKIWPFQLEMHLLRSFLPSGFL